LLDIVRIPLPEAGNDWYPLPPDYPTLTVEGQRLARINACRQWMLPNPSAEARGLAFYECVSFFDHYYLWPDQDINFDPGFYDQMPLPAPPFHRDMLLLWGSHDQGSKNCTVTVAPRGGSKSMLSAKRMLLQTLSAPIYSFVYGTATHDLAEKMGDRLRNQLTTNSRLNDDWRPQPEFDGRIQPRRGDRAWSATHFYLRNGSEWQSFSVTSRQRGIRPRRYVLDDPEYDPSASTSMEKIRAGMERLLASIIIPAVSRPNTGCDWTGTFVTARHYLYHAVQVRQTREGQRAVDPRFDEWARLIQKGAEIGPDGKLVSCWPEMWPASDEDRKQLSITKPYVLNSQTLPELERKMGPAAFRREILQEITNEADGYFAFSTSDDERLGYHLDKVDDPETLAIAPWKSVTTIKWKRAGVACEDTLANFLAKSRVFITLDTSYTAGADADYKAAVCMALTPENELFVLDMWAKQCPESHLVTESLRMADRWRASLHPEVVSKQISLWSALDQAARTRLNESMGLTWVPIVRPIKPGTTAKEAKIAVLQPRFEHGLIKFPLHRAFDMPWRMLYDQIAGFNPDIADGGGLSKDDCLDCVAMSQFVIRGRPIRGQSLTEKQRDAESDLMDGIWRDDEGMPNILKIDLLRADAETVATMISKAMIPENRSDAPSAA
jgi:hypothetical protein